MKNYYITNLYCAAFLLSKGLQPTNIVRNKEGKKRLIFFENTEELHNRIDEFYKNSYLSDYVRNVIEIKNLMYMA